MRPVSTNSTTNRTVWRLNSPIPYLFGGLALMLGLITIALILLICSHRKQAHSTPSGDAGDGKRPRTDEADLRPKILVIMAGNTKPTFLATPISSSTEKKSCDIDLV
ncbi:hypothetical protein RHMOL_Rhmol08G0089500 [Rhododendron molle]|uniref:Uncharacterized protein n=1 Tax=Rhododendron molle TaxID=49168 RepID=A0ACC0MN92_RHOML|nr:hypothetical protein RHMOL_Rhmol08G0089500 [Rhododendron molle]